MCNPPYEMTVDLNVLNHLGINLYSNSPAVLAEAVANAWDADAEIVRIEIHTDPDRIVILDDGHGMSRIDINEKFLRVGHRRREHEPITDKHNRPVMGRKGIGKLSLFSIADTIEIQSCKNGDRGGFTMYLPDIRNAIQSQDGRDKYAPPALDDGQLVVSKGTRIELRDLRKKITGVEGHLRRRLARRFSVIGATHYFRVLVNGAEITVSDRDYYPKLQFVWYYGDYGRQCRTHCTNTVETWPRTGTFEGWFGTVETPSQLKDQGDNLNRVVVMARGKLIQENILDRLDEAGFYSKYLIGEVHADFLDSDDADDIATTSRQAVVEDDPRFVALKDEIVRQLRIHS